MPHLPFSLLLTALSLALSCSAAVVVIVLHLSLMDGAVDLLIRSAALGTDALAEEVQDVLLRRSLRLLDALIATGNQEILSQVHLLYTVGITELNFTADVIAHGDNCIDRFNAINFPTMKGHPVLDLIVFYLAVFPQNSSQGRWLYLSGWNTLNVDVFHGLQRTIYHGVFRPSPNGSDLVLEVKYTDQTTGIPFLSIFNGTFIGFPNAPADGWKNDLSFVPFSGVVELAVGRWIPHGDLWLRVEVGLNTQDLSENLRSQLDGQPNDRLFLFFRRPHGHLIAASHGKYHSHSDVDSRLVNVLTDAQDISKIQLYTCLNSTDAIILEVCIQLVLQYQSWEGIPPLRANTILGGRQYWLAVGYSTSELNCTVVLLKDRQAVMGPVDASNEQVLQETRENRTIAIALFVAVAALAASLPFFLGSWLAQRLSRLAVRMDRLAQLDFGSPSIQCSFLRELHNFQHSFLQMERGLRAFRQFVPQAVVTRLVMGQLGTHDEMETRQLTVMFADIVGFSTLCEASPAAHLVEVCTEYFEALCKQVAQCDGTIDKFIGDCVMAFWNAPIPGLGHEVRAVTAALAMQEEVLSLHSAWALRSLPTVVFRLGLHTGCCLVGNFGCSHRVSYTCIGDTVNLASRLEALNKQFGTTICVSQSTRDGCQGSFHFRLLAQVAVPGCSEALTVYEVLCRAAGPVEPLGVCLSLRDIGGRALSELPLLPPSARDREPHRSSVYQLGSPGSESQGETFSRSLTDVSGSHSPVDLSEMSVGGRMVYHWQMCDPAVVLREASQYEAAYSALVEGRYRQCKELLGNRPLTSDKAWKVLADQLEIQQVHNLRWDGVFNFLQK